ncbi:MAG: hypothetical protein Q9195_002896 [Heterodermia aff. obscurata]
MLLFRNPIRVGAPSQESKNATPNLDRTNSISNELSSEVDKELRELLTIKQEEAKDVFIDDLSATLEAHRLTNRATIVRKQNQKADEGQLVFKRPIISPKIIAVDSPAKDGFILPEEQDAEVTPKPLGASMTLDNTKDDGTGLHGGDFSVATEEEAVSDKRQVEKSSRNGLRSTNWPADSVQNEPHQGKRYSIDRHEVLEYDAMYIPPRGDYHFQNRPSHPWLYGLDGYDTESKPITASRRLYEEITAYEKYMRMNSTEIEAARLFTADVKSIVRQKYPDNPLNPIGSHSTGLADRLSDFDFTLLLPDLEKPPLERGPSSTRPLATKAGIKALMNIFWSLKQSRRYRDVKIISARVPIVQAIHCKTLWKVELQTLSTNEAAREYTLYYLAEFPTLRTLYILFRSALHLRQLNIVYEGGLGSYSVLIMIVNALKHASEQYARDDLVNHFLHVLDFYSTADLYKYGFSPDPPRTFQKNREKLSTAEKKASTSDPMLRGIEIMKTYDRRKPYLLCLQDPANAVNDLGCRSYGIKHVQKLFGTIRKGLITNMKAWDGDGQFEESLHDHGLLAPLLGANYRKLANKRRRIEKWVLEEHSPRQNESSTINGQDFSLRFVNSKERLTNADLSLLDNSSYARESDHVVSESPSGELRVLPSDVSEETDANTKSHQTPLKIADQSNATSTGATIALDTVTDKPAVLREDSSAVQEPSENNKQQNVKSRAWKKWAPRPKKQPPKSEGEKDQNRKASGDTPTLVRTYASRSKEQRDNSSNRAIAEQIARDAERSSGLQT